MLPKVKAPKRTDVCPISYTRIQTDRQTDTRKHTHTHTDASERITTDGNNC